MLKIDKAPKFTMDVTVNTAALKGTFKVTYIAMPSKALIEIEDRVGKEGTGVAGFLGYVVFDVAEIDLPINLPTRPDGTFETPTDAVQALVDWPGVGPAMQKAYYRGLWEEEEKN